MEPDQVANDVEQVGVRDAVIPTFPTVGPSAMVDADPGAGDTSPLQLASTSVPIAQRGDRVGDVIAW